MITFSSLPALASNYALWPPPLQNPLLTWPVNLYQPPMFPSDVEIWSSGHLRALAAARHIARKVLFSGWDEGHRFRDGENIVALRRSYVPEAGHILDRGAWVCLSTGATGENLVELYA